MTTTAETMTAAEFAEAFGLEPDEVRDVDPTEVAEFRVMDFGQVLEGLAHKIAKSAGIDPATVPPFATETTEEATTMKLDTITNFRGMMEYIVEGVLEENPEADHETLCNKLIRLVRWQGLGDETCCPWNDEEELADCR